jgi:hypothetical protein
MLRLALLLAAFAAAMFAQTEPVYPSYFVSTGSGYTRNATPNAAEGWAASLPWT